MSILDKLLTGFKRELDKGMFAKVVVDILAKPVPASRPRVTRWGTYYGKNYTAWRKQAAELLEENQNLFSGPLAVCTEVLVPKPKTTKRHYPRGDNDNYEKAIWDSVTKAKCAWDDDDQVIANLTVKRYSQPSEQSGVYLTIYELEEKE